MEISVTMEIFYMRHSSLATNYMGLLSSWNFSSATEELKYYFFLKKLINLNLYLSSNKYLLVTILDSAALGAQNSGTDGERKCLKCLWIWKAKEKRKEKMAD